LNKTELIEHIANQADISKAAAGRALEALLGGIKTSLKKGNSVTLVGFGTFIVGKRAARTGRNPRTNQPIKIKAAKVPKFRAGKALKDCGAYLARAGALFLGGHVRVRPHGGFSARGA
jgi:DNA-binding protein HU-beta